MFESQLVIVCNIVRFHGFQVSSSERVLETSDLLLARKLETLFEAPNKIQLSNTTTTTTTQVALISVLETANRATVSLGCGLSASF